MKKISLSILLTLCLLFSGCIMFVPSSDVIGQAKTFSKDGITLTLTDRFEEVESQRGFDAYYSSDFCGVVIMKEPFTLEEGLADRPLSEYIENVIKNNGLVGIEPEYVDGLWTYVKDTDTTRVYAYCYKGSDAFWYVQFVCRLSDAPTLQDTITLFAQSVTVE